MLEPNFLTVGVGDKDKKREEATVICVILD